MGKNKGDFVVWRDLVNGNLGANGEIPFDMREFTTRRSMGGIVAPETEFDKGSIIPIGSAADKDWHYFWHRDDKSEWAAEEQEILREKGYQLATTDRFQPNREYYRVDGDKIRWKQTVCYVIDRERYEKNEAEEKHENDVRNGLVQASTVTAAARNVHIGTEAFDIFDNKEVRAPRSKVK